MIAKELSNKTSIPFGFDPKLAKEVLAISVKDMPLRDLMDRIAHVTLGEWAKAGDGYRLIPSAEKAKTEQQELDGKRRESIQKQLSEKVDREALTKPVDYEAMASKALELQNQFSQAMSDPAQRSKYTALNTEMQGLTKDSPETRLIGRLALTIPIDELLSVPPGGRRVFSTNPNQIQSAFPSSAAQVVSAFEKEYSAWANGLQKAKETVGIDNTNGRYWGTGWPNLTARPLSKGVGKVLLTVSRANYLTGLSIAGIVYDGNGFPAAMSNLTLVTAGLSQGSLPKEMPGSGPIDLPKSALDFAAAVYASRSPSSGPTRYQVMYLNGKQVQIGFPVPNSGIPEYSADTLELLRSPAKSEPLSVYAGPILLACADSAQRQIVANMPDKLFEPLTMYLASKPTVERLWPALRTAGMDVRDEDGVITARSHWLLPDRERIDRPALQRMLQSAQRRGSLDTLEFAEYMQTSPILFPTGRTIDECYLSCHRGRVVSASELGLELYQIPNRVGWKVLGSIGMKVLRPLLGQDALRLTSPANPLGANCGQFLFGGTGLPVIEPAVLPKAGDGDPLMIRPGLYEATEVFASGIAPQIRLSLSLDTDEAVLAYSAENGGPITLNAASLAQVQITNFQVKKNFQPLSAVTCTIILENPAGDKAQFKVTVYEKTGQAECEYSQLSAAFRNRVEEAKKFLQGGGS